VALHAPARPFGHQSSWLLAQTADEVAALYVVQSEVDRRSGGYPAISYSYHPGKPRGFWAPTSLRARDTDRFVTKHRIAPMFSHSTVANAVAMPLDQESEAHVRALWAECAADAGLQCASIVSLSIVPSLPAWWDGDGAAPWYCDGAVCSEPSP
jgi:hypothetical protein